MAKEVLRNAHVTIDGVDLSDRVRNITLPLSTDEIETTCMGSDYKESLAGLKGASLDITFAQDFSSGKVDETLWDVYNGSAAVTVAVRKDAGVTSATNPEYGFDVIMSSYTPITGQSGAFHEVPASFTATGAVSRSTS